MAVQGPIPVDFAQVFPRGVFAAGAFEPVRDFEPSKGGRFVQSKDKQTGLPLWAVEVIDADPQAQALAQPIPALPIPQATNLRALPVGRREDGSMLTVRLSGTHLLVAGATGAGKGSWLWSLVRAMLPAMAAGLVRVLACDPKLMELAFGRALFDRYGRYAADPGDIAALLEDAVADMQARATRFAGKQRDHIPTAEFRVPDRLSGRPQAARTYARRAGDTDHAGTRSRVRRGSRVAGSTQGSPEHPQSVPRQDRATAR
jgi:FtsK/SpoIIIE family